MEISTSDLIASLALVVSIGSFYYTKRQSETANGSYRNDYRAQLSEHHERYRSLLAEEAAAHKAGLRELSRLASTTMSDFIDFFDVLDESRGLSLRPLRHLIHESAEMVYYSVKGQMGWQRGLNLSFRLRHFSRIEDNLAPTKDHFNQGNFRSMAHKLYLQDRSFWLENILPEDKYFSSLVSELKQRISASNGARLLIEENHRIEELASLWESKKPAFERSHERLEDNLNENDVEHFRLQESSRLFEKYGQLSATLDILVHLNFIKVEEEYANKYSNFISVCIYNCALLHALIDVESWGWSPE